VGKVDRFNSSQHRTPLKKKTTKRKEKKRKEKKKEKKPY